MALSVTYYFNAYTVGVWADPDNLVDGDTGTFATTGARSTAQTLTGNTCPGDDLGAISKVEIRLYGYGDTDDRIDITPVFAGGNGDTHEWTPPYFEPGTWSPYIDITNDTNAPSPWTWADVQNLDCIINSVAVGKGNTLGCAKVEIKVWYAWTPPVSDIDVGSGPEDRTGQIAKGATYIDKNNPANASGTLHSIKIWAESSMTGLIVGTFYTTNGNDLKCRDSELIGDVEAGAERTFSELSIEVQEGDYIGCYYANGTIELDSFGDGLWWLSGEHIDPNDEATYSFTADRAISLYGYGDIAAPPEVGLENKSANMGSKMVAAGLI